MSEKTKIAIVGYGNVGRGVHQAVLRNPDMSLAGIISRDPERVKKELESKAMSDILVFDGSEVIGASLRNAVDVAILCGGSKKDLPEQGPFYAKYFSTVDSFDTHASIPEYFERMDRIAKDNWNVAVISTGWDPGTFSQARVSADAFIPGAKHYTFWGKGVSQGHSDAVRQIPGVKDARQYTIPVEDAIKRVREGENPELTTREKHTRLVYVVAKDDVDEERRQEIAEKIRTMPNYFADYDTTILFITEEEMKREHSKMPHGGFVMAAGQTGEGNKALIEYRCQWESNPEATGNILVAHARAASRLKQEEKSGAFTILDIPAAYLSPRSREELLRDFM
jgi:diaminopimelate dehydrogenase